VGVASLSKQPSPDYESARYHLEHAKEMIEAMMEIDCAERNVSAYDGCDVDDDCCDGDDDDAE